MGRRTSVVRKMGNVKSMNRAEIEQAAKSGEWDQNDDILEVVKDAQSKKKRVSRTTRQERLMEASDIDEIYDLVQSLRNQGKEGEELLDKFVQRRTRKSVKESDPPIRTIFVDTSSVSHAGKTRTRALAA